MSSDRPVATDALETLGTRFVSRAEQAANARLIAAAPVMFDQGQALMTALDRYGFPVSNAALPALRESGSVEANAVHDAAVDFRAALASVEPQL